MMRAVANPEPRARTDDVARQVGANTAEIAILRDSVAKLELMFGKMCAALGIDPPPPPAVGAEWSTIKATAADMGFSQTRVRQWIASGAINSTRRGGRVLVDVASTKKLLERKQHRAHKVGS